MERFDLVQRAYNELVNSGDVKDLPPGTPDLERKLEEQKAYVTRRAGYYLHTEHTTNIGLLSKTTGNNVLGLSVDIVIDKVTAIFYDIASDNGRRATIVNAGGNHDPALVPRWVQPTRELAGLPANGGNGGTEPPDNIEEKLNLIIAQNNELKNMLSTMQQVLAHVNINTNEIKSLSQQILDKPTGGGPFPITWPTYRGRVLGFNIVLAPDPPMNP